MAKYTFKCQSCEWTGQKYASASSTSTTCEKCSGVADRQLPTLNGPANVTEVVDKYTGLTVRPDQKEQVKSRRDEYYWTVEVPRMVASGTYSVETMLENGWIFFDDSGKIHINKTPPHKR